LLCLQDEGRLTTGAAVLLVYWKETALERRGAIFEFVSRAVYERDLSEANAYLFSLAPLIFCRVAGRKRAGE